MKRQYNIEYMRNSMENEGYKLISNTYSSLRKLKYVCDKGHESSMLVSNWVKGRRCPVCSPYKLSDMFRLDFDVVKKSFQYEGYKLLSTETDYKDNKTKLRYICPKGHKHSIAWGHWQQGKRCAYCANRIPLTIAFIKDNFKINGYMLKNTTYKSGDRLYYICSMGHEHDMAWGHWQQGERCPTCYNISRFGAGHPNWQGGISYEPYCQIWKDKEYKEDIKIRDGYKCLNPCCDSKNPNNLVIHHIDYNKKNCGPDNIITVCKSCNGKANKDRAWHKDWYTSIIKNRYYTIYHKDT